MLIAQIEPIHLTRGGDFFYRTYSPGLALAEQDGVHVVNLRSSHPARDELFENADIVILNMLCDPDLFPLILDRAQRKQPTVFELNDDVAALSSHSPTAAFYQNPEHQLLFRMLVKACSIAQFSSNELEGLYGRFAEKSAIFANQLSSELLSPEERSPHAGRLVVGWGGSAGHFDDLAAIATPLVKWLTAREGVVLHLMCNDRIWTLFNALSPDKKRHFPPGSIEDYHRFLAELDIGIAPLEDVAFNRSRSDVKFLEYALHGVVPLLQNVAPYRSSIEPGTTGLYFDDPPSLLQALDQLITNEPLRMNLGQAAQRHVLESRTERGHVARRLEFYRSLLPLRDSSGKGLAWLDQRLQRFPVSRQGRQWTLEPCEYEQLLHDALVLGQQDQRLSEGLALLESAAALEPHAYLPHLFSAALSHEPVACLERALERNPRSIKARVMLAERQFSAKAFMPAITNLMKAAELYPAYDVPYVRLSRFMASLGKSQEATSFAGLAAQLRAPFRDSTAESRQ